jgi:processive 1,2-diacylglycerol beta-glucosyltransferase
MAAADLFISKPGGLTTAESTACGLPMILTDPIPGQEVYNAMYLLEHGAAVIPTSPATIGYKVERLLEDPERLERLSRQSGSLGKPRAAFHILEEVLAHRGERAISVQRAVEELA